jgi:malonyl-CoA decarboxylase
MDGRLARLLNSVFSRRRAAARIETVPQGDSHVVELERLCNGLLSGRGEASGVKLAETIIARYSALDEEGRRDFFAVLATRFAPEKAAVKAAWERYESVGDRRSFQDLVGALEPPRQELFRRINRAPRGTSALVEMRSDLLRLLRNSPEIGVVDDDLVHLLRSWFNRGFLVMERIGWSTPADLLERVIRYEAVHHIGDWDELRRRLLPSDRRCYAFFHPALAHDPLIFVQVALTREIPSSIQSVLAQVREVVAPEEATTAVFYSISNCQPGLQGISFGNFLIKQVVEELLRTFPGLKTFVTLSPVPGFSRWLAKASDRLPEGSALAAMLASGTVPIEPAEEHAVAAQLLPLAARYLVDEKDAKGRPLDPVARFHLGNGARLERLCWPADESANGVATGAGLMVNYLYDLGTVESNHEVFANERRVIASDAVRRHLKSRPRTNVKEA